MTGTAPGPGPLAGLDPARFAAALSVLPINHPLVVAAALAVETAHTRHERRTSHQQVSHDISGAADWSRIASNHITHDELEARRARPAYPGNHPRVKEPVMTDQPRPHSHRAVVAARIAAQEAVTELARSRAADPGYVLVGPSARTWLRDPATGLPAVEVSEEEHRAVEGLLQQEIADAAEPQWVTGPDGRDDIHTAVTLTDHDEDHDQDHGGAGARAFSPEQAAARMTEVGHNPADAETMVSDYLAANTARWGEPAGGWVIDDHDLAEIERSYEWVDHYRGETIAQARERAAGYAQGWARTAPHVDRDHSPGYAAHVDRQVRTWTERAAGTPARADGIYGEDPDPWAVEQDAEDWERAGLDTDPMPDPWANAPTPAVAAEADGSPDREEGGPVRDEPGPDLPGLPDLAPDLTTPAPEASEPTVREIADLTARLRSLTRRDSGPARDAAERAAFLADKEALLARIPVTDHAGARTPTTHTVGRAEQAAAHRGAAEHGGPDRSDLDAIAAEQRVAAVRDAVNRAGTEPARTSRQAEGITEQDRRAQLAAWAHAETDDHDDSAEHGMEQQR